MNGSSFAVIVVIASVLAGGGAGPLAPNGGPEPRDILLKAGKAYSECKAYKDSGVVRNVRGPASEPGLVELHFKTAFVRPKNFRFSCSQGLPGGKAVQYVVYKNDQVIQTWWDLRGTLETFQSLDDAIVSTAGVSLFTAYTVPALLMPDIPGVKVTDMAGASRSADEKIGDSLCFVVKGKMGSFDAVVWIDATSYLIRRLRMTASVDGEIKGVLADYEPLVDVAPDEAELALGVPGAK